MRTKNFTPKILGTVFKEKFSLKITEYYDLFNKNRMRELYFLAVQNNGWSIKKNIF